MYGTVLHVSAGKKVAIGKDKKAKRDVTYHRLVFLR
jgi:hypothetical protein